MWPLRACTSPDLRDRQHHHCDRTAAEHRDSAQQMRSTARDHLMILRPIVKPEDWTLIPPGHTIETPGWRDISEAGSSGTSTPVPDVKVKREPGEDVREVIITRSRAASAQMTTAGAKQVNLLRGFSVFPDRSALQMADVEAVRQCFPAVWPDEMTPVYIGVGSKRVYSCKTSGCTSAISRLPPAWSHVARDHVGRCAVCPFCWEAASHTEKGKMKGFVNPNSLREHIRDHHVE